MIRATASRRIGYIAAYIGAGAYAAAILVPLLFLLLSSVRSNQEIFSSPLSLPEVWRWDNYARAFTAANLGPSLQVSVGVSVGAVLLTVLLAIPAAYAIARVSQGRASRWVEGAFAAGLLIPSFAVLVPAFFLAIRLGMLNQPLFLVLFYPATGLPVSVLLLVQFMRSIPRAIDEAATLDGASRWAILRRIVVPMSVPGITTVVIFNFISYWNEYIFALVLLGGGPFVTAQVTLPRLQADRVVEYGLVAAGAVIVMAPVLICYLLLQKQTQRALTAGAVKE